MSHAFTHEIVRARFLADTLTPVTLYHTLCQAPRGYLLESVEGGERWGRYSMIGLPAREWVKVKNGVIQHFVAGTCVEESREDPFLWLERYHGARRIANLPGDLPFAGGLVGYFAYDTIGYIEKKLRRRPEQDPLNVADMLFCLSEEVVVLDNLRGEAHVLVLADLADPLGKEKAMTRIGEITDAISRASLPPLLAVQEADISRFSPQYELGEAGYKAAVAKIRDYIVAGDVMQVVPSQRMSIPFRRSPLELYRALRVTNPSPYMYLMDFEDHQIVASSPEILARMQGGKVTVRPIAGTRKRGATVEEDLALERELLADEKERAEHAMLIDLGRNDVGRISKPGSVKITEKMVIERYSHVMHIVSNVEGEVRDGVSALDALKATFPAGTLSGAPKIRAMQIIDEVEVSRRGVYGGACGYWSWSGNMDMAITIRTGLIKDGRLYVQAGGGIVYDSEPEAEWQETLNKSMALIKAASMLLP